MKRLVIDASVVLKWFLVDEKHGQNALKILDEYIADEVDLLGPSLLEYEVINGLFVAQKKGRVGEEKIRLALDGFAGLEIKMREVSHLYSQIMDYCQAYKCSAYDASYLAMASFEEIDLITADEVLYKTVHQDLKWVKWLGE